MLFSSFVSVGIWTNEPALEVLANAESLAALKVSQYDDKNPATLRVLALREILMIPTQYNAQHDSHMIWEVSSPSAYAFANRSRNSSRDDQVAIHSMPPPTAERPDLEIRREPSGRSEFHISAKRLGIIGRQEHRPNKVDRYVKLFIGGHHAEGTKLAGEYLAKQAWTLNASLRTGIRERLKPGEIRTTLWFVDGGHLITTCDLRSTWDDLNRCETPPPRSAR